MVYVQLLLSMCTFFDDFLAPVSCSAVVGEIDEDLDSDINLSDIRAEPLNPV